MINGETVNALCRISDFDFFLQQVSEGPLGNCRVFSGWFITVDNAMLFLTKTSGSTNNQSYVSIEHNLFYCPNWACPCYSYCASCPKGAPYCSGSVCGNSVC